jgi:hypothetical protein
MVIHTFLKIFYKSAAKVEEKGISFYEHCLAAS